MIKVGKIYKVVAKDTKLAQHLNCDIDIWTKYFFRRNVLIKKIHNAEQILYYKIQFGDYPVLVVVENHTSPGEYTHSGTWVPSRWIKLDQGGPVWNQPSVSSI